MVPPRQIGFSVPAVSHDPDVFDREVLVGGVRWAVVEYSPGSGRVGWCEAPHSGYVVSGAITYEFEDGSADLAVGAGEAFVLPTAPRHRGRNEGAEVARLFIIDGIAS